MERAQRSITWLFSLLLGLAGALLGYLIFTVGLGIGDSHVFDFVARRRDYRRDHPVCRSQHRRRLRGVKKPARH